MRSSCARASRRRPRTARSSSGPARCCSSSLTSSANTCSRALEQLAPVGCATASAWPRREPAPRATDDESRRAPSASRPAAALVVRQAGKRRSSSDLPAASVGPLPTKYTDSHRAAPRAGLRDLRRGDLHVAETLHRNDTRVERHREDLPTRGSCRWCRGDTRTARGVAPGANGPVTVTRGPSRVGLRRRVLEHRRARRAVGMSNTSGRPGATGDGERLTMSSSRNTCEHVVGDLDRQARVAAERRARCASDGRGRRTAGREPPARCRPCRRAPDAAGRPRAQRARPHASRRGHLELLRLEPLAVDGRDARARWCPPAAPRTSPARLHRSSRSSAAPAPCSSTVLADDVVRLAADDANGDRAVGQVG